ncbi:MAG TPA: HTH domain-containing protein [Rhizomicrobium sp.]|nr:HTH domain-containing protein [Rhizomicrobium sp.]
MAVVALLKQDGPMSAGMLAGRLGITAAAVRLHLAALESDGIAAFTRQLRPRGRPVQIWRLTGKGDSYFADCHAALAGELILQTRKAFGEEGVDRVLALRTGEQERAYRARVAAARSLKARLERLAKIRSSEGYMARVERDPDCGEWLLVENHCPICAAARLCCGICREELALFRRVLGKDVRVERSTHIVSGDRSCSYRISQAR